MKLIIPSADRFYKLTRTLQYYSSLDPNSFELDIYVLDGSDAKNAIEYKTLCNKYNVNYLEWNDLDLNSRLLKASDELLLSDEIFLIGNDEDVFTPNYIHQSKIFMEENSDYSTYLGNYFTLAKPLLGMSRVPFERLTIESYDLNAEDPGTRMAMLSRLLLVGISPLFYGVRRSNQFQLSCKVFNDIQYGSAGEFADQILLSYFGKIFCSDEIMLIRDETKVKHKISENHQRNAEYISRDDLSELETALANHSDIDFSAIRSFALNWVPLNKHNSTMAMLKFLNYYSPFKKAKVTDVYLNTAFRTFLTIFEIINYFRMKNKTKRAGVPVKVLKKVLMRTKVS